MLNESRDSFTLEKTFYSTGSHARLGAAAASGSRPSVLVCACKQKMVLRQHHGKLVVGQTVRWESQGLRPHWAAKGKPCAVVCRAAAGSSRTGSNRSRSLAGTPRPLLLDSRSPRELQPGEEWRSRRRRRMSED